MSWRSSSPSRPTRSWIEPNPFSHLGRRRGPPRSGGRMRACRGLNEKAVCPPLPITAKRRWAPSSPRSGRGGRRLARNRKSFTPAPRVGENRRELAEVNPAFVHSRRFFGGFPPFLSLG